MSNDNAVPVEAVGIGPGQFPARRRVGAGACLATVGPDAGRKLTDQLSSAGGSAPPST